MQGVSECLLDKGVAGLPCPSRRSQWGGLLRGLGPGRLQGRPPCLSGCLRFIHAAATGLTRPRILCEQNKQLKTRIRGISESDHAHAAEGRGHETTPRSTREVGHFCVPVVGHSPRLQVSTSSRRSQHLGCSGAAAGRGIGREAMGCSRVGGPWGTQGPAHLLARSPAWGGAPLRPPRGLLTQTVGARPPAGVPPPASGL